MTELYLIDTSALVRFYRGQVGTEWDQTVSAGLVGICEPVRQEYLRAVGGRPAFYEAGNLLQETFPYYVIPESAWDETSELQRDLADKGWHQSASPVDLLMAVTARHHKLTVLHADADFDTISRLTGQPSRWIS
ncbi:PIN domain nuclease [Streptosporangium sp. NBC_01755]|uniref:PIN domain nuclease n=1 Tax=unclassified Streptosporangium TaxID=2632669 RepID=UPI002DD7BB42|nr:MULTISPECIES: PIN domain nuclease [unclassified Streptosporangium]WSA25647.1 PIN domain nuclease [Streptosporangium sp. NBC_01810]WSD02963.1 PIN domain nuclease [Streptosporangium sp. NBC_01755]